MKVDILLGLQWGDEGKGKLVDYLAPQYDVIARFQGGPNAGHTLEFDGIKHVLHQIPSGIFRPGVKNIIGNGVVLDPVVFLKEVVDLDPYNLPVQESLYLSEGAQIILPTHKLLDAAYEKSKGQRKIGSTLRGIGPTYQDKVARVGLRLGDVTLPDFQQKYEALRDQHRRILDYYQYDYDLGESEPAFLEAVEQLRAFRIVNTSYLINDELTAGQRVLAEGAQGSMLDIDFGSFPFVTSSTTMAAGACTGLGIAPSRIGDVFGVFKAYATRVGGGPFPTELFDQDGERLQKEGNEFGATTGRPRRCGWLDLVALRYACMINGVTQLFMMKADVLNTFERIRLSRSYTLGNGKATNQLPYDLERVEFQPDYEDHPGWQQGLEGISDYDHMPAAFREYVAVIEQEMGLPVKIVSIGPGREQTLVRA